MITLVQLIVIFPLTSSQLEKKAWGCESWLILLNLPWHVYACLCWSLLAFTRDEGMKGMSGWQKALQTIVIDCAVWLGRIWWKLEYHNFILKMYFSGRANHVVLITDQFWIKWLFWKNVIFCPKTTFLGKKWLFDLLPSSA